MRFSEISSLLSQSAISSRGIPSITQYGPPVAIGSLCIARGHQIRHILRTLAITWPQGFNAMKKIHFVVAQRCMAMLGMGRVIKILEGVILARDGRPRELISLFNGPVLRERNTKHVAN